MPDSNSGLRRFVRPDLLTMAGYEPVVPVEVRAAQLGIPEDRIVKLDANENLFGPSPGVLAALASAERLNIYPDPNQDEVREAVGDYLGVPPELVVAGVGSDELIDVIARLFTAPGDRIVNLVPTFGMYKWAADVSGAELVEVVRKADFTIDVDAVRAAIDERTKLIFVASPNNPTGNAVSRREFEALVGLGIPMVIDEAYAEFAGENHARLVPEYQNLIALRTMSKWAALAGLRIGYGVFPPSIVDLVRTVKQPYSFHVPAQVALLAALRDRAYLMERVAMIVAERERVIAALSEVPYLRPFPSQANFVLCGVLGRDARGVRDALAARGIFVRYYNEPLLQACIRVSVGLPEHSERLIEALHEIEAT